MIQGTIFGVPLTWLIAAQFALLPPGFLLIMMTRAAAKDGSWAHAVLATLIVLAFGPILFVIAFTNALTVPQQPGPLFPAQVGPALLVWAGINFGGVFYLLRSRHKAIFGAIEVLVAVATLAITASGMTPETFVATTLGFLGGVYVFVRGLTNMADARAATAQPS
jgi:hypothetical protein